MVTNFNSASKLKIKLNPANKFQPSPCSQLQTAQNPVDNSYINYNNLLINSKVLNANDEDNEDDQDEQQTINNSNNYFDSEQDMEEYDAQSQVTVGDQDDEEEQDEHEQNQQEDQDDDENNNQINSITDYADKLTEWSRLGSAGRRSRSVNLDEKMFYEDIIQVNCNSILAELHKNKFGSGGKGRCVRVLVDNANASINSKSNDSSSSAGAGAEPASGKSERWMTPIEFETFCGKGNCRDWKRTIKVGGHQILAVLDAEILTCHAVSCSCSVCNQNESLVGPIKPFTRYRRRKKDEILAQNAFKKFLSLKPPTLLPECAFMSNTNPNTNTNIQNSNINSTNGNLSTSITPTVNNSSNNTRVNQMNKNSNLNEEMYGYANNSAGNSNNSVNNMNNASRHYNNHNSSFNNCGNPNTDDLIRFINKIQETEEKKWSTLEQLANEMISQTKSLQSQIELAKRESELNRKVLIDKILASSPTPQPTITRTNYNQNHNISLNNSINNQRNFRDRSSLKRKLSVENNSHQLNYNNMNINGSSLDGVRGNENANDEVYVLNDEDDENAENDNFDELEEDFFKEKKTKF